MSNILEKTENGVELWRSDLLQGGQVVASAFIVKDPKRTPEVWPFNSKEEALRKYTECVDAAK